MSEIREDAALVSPQSGNDEVIERWKRIVKSWEGQADSFPLDISLADLRHLLALAKPSPQADGERGSDALERSWDALSWIAETCRAEMGLEYSEGMHKVLLRNIVEVAQRILNPVPSSDE